MPAAATAAIRTRSVRHRDDDVPPQIGDLTPQLGNRPFPRIAFTPLIQLPAKPLQLRAKVAVMMMVVVSARAAMIVAVVVAMIVATIFYLAMAAARRRLTAGFVASIAATLTQVALQIFDRRLELLDLLLKRRHIRLTGRTAVRGVTALRLTGGGRASFGHDCSPTRQRSAEIRVQSGRAAARPERPRGQSRVRIRRTAAGAAARGR